jgi:hypothetical protein
MNREPEGTTPSGFLFATRRGLGGRWGSTCWRVSFIIRRWSFRSGCSDSGFACNAVSIRGSGCKPRIWQSLPRNSQESPSRFWVLASEKPERPNPQQRAKSLENHCLLTGLGVALAVFSVCARVTRFVPEKLAAMKSAESVLRNMLRREVTAVLAELRTGAARAVAFRKCRRANSGGARFCRDHAAQAGRRAGTACARARSCFARARAQDAMTIAPRPYSVRSAFMGSIDAAFRAGSVAASRATRDTSTVPARRVNGSKALTP